MKKIIETTLFKIVLRGLLVLGVVASLISCAASEGVTNTPTTVPGERVGNFLSGDYFSGTFNGEAVEIEVVGTEILVGGVFNPATGVAGTAGELILSAAQPLPAGYVSDLTGTSLPLTDLDGVGADTVTNENLGTITIAEGTSLNPDDIVDENSETYTVKFSIDAPLSTSDFRVTSAPEGNELDTTNLALENRGTPSVPTLVITGGLTNLADDLVDYTKSRIALLERTNIFGETVFRMNDIVLEEPLGRNSITISNTLTLINFKNVETTYALEVQYEGTSVSELLMYGERFEITLTVGGYIQRGDVSVTGNTLNFSNLFNPPGVTPDSVEITIMLPSGYSQSAYTFSDPSGTGEMTVSGTTLTVAEGISTDSADIINNNIETYQVEIAYSSLPPPFSADDVGVYGFDGEAENTVVTLATGPDRIVISGIKNIPDTGLTIGNIVFMERSEIFTISIGRITFSNPTGIQGTSRTLADTVTITNRYPTGGILAEVTYQVEINFEGEPVADFLSGDYFSGTFNGDEVEIEVVGNDILVGGVFNEALGREGTAGELTLSAAQPLPAGYVSDLTGTSLPLTDIDGVGADTVTNDNLGTIIVAEGTSTAPFDIVNENSETYTVKFSIDAPFSKDDLLITFNGETLDLASVDLIADLNDPFSPEYELNLMGITNAEDGLGSEGSVALIERRNIFGSNIYVLPTTSFTDPPGRASNVVNSNNFFLLTNLYEGDTTNYNLKASFVGEAVSNIVTADLFTATLTSGSEVQTGLVSLSGTAITISKLFNPAGMTADSGSLTISLPAGYSQSVYTFSDPSGTGEMTESGTTLTIAEGVSTDVADIINNNVETYTVEIIYIQK